MGRFYHHQIFIYNLHNNFLKLPFLPMKPKRKLLWYLFSISCFFIVFTSACFAQNVSQNKYGLTVIKTKKEFKKSVKNNPAAQLVNLKKYIPSIVFDLRYASDNNFMQQKLYPPIITTYLRKAAADSLLAVQKALNKMALGLKIFDAYRPYSVTEKMWQLVHDDRYAADPKTGSGHNRGIAVDLTIIDLQTMQELNMGTNFDNFSDTAHHDFTALPPNVVSNRKLLKDLMELHGFKPLQTEWWHYSFTAAKNEALLDIPFKKIKNN